jgi:murein lipoprotein
MKKSLSVIIMMLALAIAIGGCATKGDLEQVEAREKMIGAKADQAAQDAEAAKAAAEERR